MRSSTVYRLQLFTRQRSRDVTAASVSRPVPLPFPLPLGHPTGNPTFTVNDFSGLWPEPPQMLSSKVAETAREFIRAAPLAAARPRLRSAPPLSCTTRLLSSAPLLAPGTRQPSCTPLHCGHRLHTKLSADGCAAPREYCASAACKYTPDVTPLICGPLRPHYRPRCGRSRGLGITAPPISFRGVLLF